MDDSEEPSGELMPREEVSSSPTPSDDDSSGSDLNLPAELQALIDLEHARIRSTDRRTAVMEKFYEVLDAQDKRQYEFHKSNADQVHEVQRQRLQFTRRMATASFVVTAFVICLLLRMVFWGGDKQASMAVTMVKYLFAALGGAGVYVLTKSWLGPILRGDDTT